jgi:CRP-like cAMP-binding protein
MSDRKRILSEIPLFSGLEDRELGELAEVTRRKRLAPQEVLCRKGDESGDVFVIVSGRLRAYSTGKDGREVVFRHQGPGEVVGELGAFASGKRTVNVDAIEESELLVIPRRDFLPVLRRFPDIAIRLLQIVAARVTHLTEAMEDASFRKLDARLAKCLLGFAKNWGKQTDDGVAITVRLRQADLGELIGATRESVNHVIRAWSREGILSVRAGHITIRQPQALEQLAGA